MRDKTLESAILKNEIKRLTSIQAEIAEELSRVIGSIVLRKGTDGAMKLSIRDWMAIKTAYRMAAGEDE